VEATDTTVVATDTAASASDTTAAAAPAAAAGGTTAVAAAEESGTNIDPQVYMNFFYGILLVLLICVLVGVIGKIIQVYELTRRMNGKDTTHYMRNFNAK